MSFRQITMTDWQWRQLRKAIQKRLQYLRAGQKRGHDNLQKIIAMEAILNTDAALIDCCTCCGPGQSGCIVCDPVGPWCATCTCQH